MCAGNEEGGKVGSKGEEAFCSQVDGAKAGAEGWEGSHCSRPLKMAGEVKPALCVWRCGCMHA